MLSLYGIAAHLEETLASPVPPAHLERQLERVPPAVRAALIDYAHAYEKLAVIQAPVAIGVKNAEERSELCDWIWGWCWSRRRRGCWSEDSCKSTARSEGRGAWRRRDCGSFCRCSLCLRQKDRDEFILRHGARVVRIYAAKQLEILCSCARVNMKRAAQTVDLDDRLQ
jgi:hypothetical protein